MDVRASEEGVVLDVANEFRKGAWLSSTGHYAAAMNLYTRLLFSTEGQVDYDLRAEALACLAASIWRLCLALGHGEADEYIPLIEDAVERATGSVAEARALLSGAWICSDGGRILDSGAIDFLARAQAVIATHVWREINSEWAMAVHIARELALAPVCESPDAAAADRVERIFALLKIQGDAIREAR